ncbi:MAG: diadenylate cyclase CdaA [Ignavibacteriales bacterium]|nr:diadenylate cyclase CdaA [Ignavibacteriales bacterium]
MFDLFKIGFLTITFLDVVDVLIVAYIIYNVYGFIKGTIAAQIFIGLIIVVLLSFVAQAANLKALGWLLKIITDIWVIAFIVLFQPEIRRLLLLVGRNPFFKWNLRRDEKNIANILTESAFELSQLQHGALIVLVKTTGVKSFIESGIILKAKLSKSLLMSIFYPRSPLHDGAVIIKNDSVEAARCTLPLSSTTIVDGHSLGMRHRAGLGIAEQADVLSLIVSEETGSISIAEEGKLTKGLSKEKLRERLSVVIEHQKERGLKAVFSGNEKES